MGETLTGIARRHGTTVEALVRLNHLDRSNFIWVGQRILVPAVGAVSGSQTGWSTARFPEATRARMAHRAVIRDLIVEVRIVLPKILDERSKELLREFGKINQRHDVRGDLFGQ